ncbi:MAG TPA: rRNA large subunit methyltransferase I, partial [Pyrinomonadaceae bacterium]
VRGYKEINLRALKLLNPGGVLISCTCSYHMSEEMLLAVIADAAVDARRRLQLVEKRMQASDHPVLLGVPETYYLKCVIVRVLD